VTQVKKLRMEAEMRESMKDKMTLAMNLRIAKKNKAFKLQETDSQKILTKNGHRITEELWCIPTPPPDPKPRSIVAWRFLLLSISEDQSH
jgi:hypothetical protein